VSVGHEDCYHRNILPRHSPVEGSATKLGSLLEVVNVVVPIISHRALRCGVTTLSIGASCAIREPAAFDDTALWTFVSTAGQSHSSPASVTTVAAVCALG